MGLRVIVTRGSQDPCAPRVVQADFQTRQRLSARLAFPVGIRPRRDARLVHSVQQEHSVPNRHPQVARRVYPEHFLHQGRRLVHSYVIRFGRVSTAAHVQMLAPVVQVTTAHVRQVS